MMCHRCHIEKRKSMEDLLIRYYEGSLSAEDRKKVEDWIRSSSENAEIARNILRATLALDTLNVIENIHTDGAVDKVCGRIKKNSFMFYLRRMEQIAAVLFIPLFMLTLFLWKKDGVKDVRMVEVRTNPGMTTNLTLPDGTNVSLNSESVLSYPEAFTGNERRVRLEGEGFFDVVSDAQKKFIVETLHSTKIEVLGTAFDLEAYPDDSIISTTLIRGKVCFYDGYSSTSLFPGEKLIYNAYTEQIEKNETSGVCEVAWKDGMLVFQNTMYDDAVRMLEKRFNVDIVTANSKYKEDAFTGSFTDQRLERILEIFKLSSGINWRYDLSSTNEGEKSKIIIY